MDDSNRLESKQKQPPEASFRQLKRSFLTSRRKVRELTRISDHWNDQVSAAHIEALIDETNATFFTAKTNVQDANEEAKKRIAKLKALRDAVRSRNERTIERNDRNLQRSVVFLEEAEKGTVERILKTKDTRLMSIRKHASSISQKTDISDVSREEKIEANEEEGKERRMKEKQVELCRIEEKLIRTEISHLKELKKKLDELTRRKRKPDPHLVQDQLDLLFHQRISCWKGLIEDQGQELGTLWHWVFLELEKAIKLEQEVEGFMTTLKSDVSPKEKEEEQEEGACMTSAISMLEALSQASSSFVEHLVERNVQTVREEGLFVDSHGDNALFPFFQLLNSSSLGTDLQLAMDELERGLRDHLKREDGFSQEKCVEKELMELIWSATHRVSEGFANQLKQRVKDAVGEEMSSHVTQLLEEQMRKEEEEREEEERRKREEEERLEKERIEREELEAQERKKETFLTLSIPLQNKLLYARPTLEAMEEEEEEDERLGSFVRGLYLRKKTLFKEEEEEGEEEEVTGHPLVVFDSNGRLHKRSGISSKVTDETISASVLPVVSLAEKTFSSIRKLAFLLHSPSFSTLRLSLLQSCLRDLNTPASSWSKQVEEGEVQWTGSYDPFVFEDRYQLLQLIRSGSWVKEETEKTKGLETEVKVEIGEVKKEISEAKKQLGAMLGELTVSVFRLERTKRELEGRLYSSRKRVLRDYPGTLTSPEIEGRWLKGELPIQVDENFSWMETKPHKLTRLFTKADDVSGLEKRIKRQIRWWKERIDGKRDLVSKLAGIWKLEMEKRKEARLARKRELEAQLTLSRLPSSHASTSVVRKPTGKEQGLKKEKDEEEENHQHEIEPKSWVRRSGLDMRPPSLKSSLIAPTPPAPPALIELRPHTTRERTYSDQTPSIEPKPPSGPNRSQSRPSFRSPRLNQVKEV